MLRSYANIKRKLERYNYTEIAVFIVYLVFMLGIGVVFFVKTKNGGEKTYFLGGRKMGPWVSALSAGA